MGEAEHFFALFGLREDLGQPSHGGHEFHTNTHEDKTAANEELRQTGRKSGSEGPEGIDEDAPGQDAAATEFVRQPPPQETEDAACQRGDKKEVSSPIAKCRRARHQAPQAEQCWLDDQRKHEQLVDIEGKADGSDDANEPLGAGHGKLGLGG